MSGWGGGGEDSSRVFSLNAHKNTHSLATGELYRLACALDGMSEHQIVDALGTKMLPTALSVEQSVSKYQEGHMIDWAGRHYVVSSTDVTVPNQRIECSDGLTLVCGSSRWPHTPSLVPSGATAHGRGGKHYVCGVPWGWYALEHEADCWCWGPRHIKEWKNTLKYIDVSYEQLRHLSEPVAAKLAAVVACSSFPYMDYIDYTRPWAHAGPRAWTKAWKPMVNDAWRVRCGLGPFEAPRGILDISRCLPYSADLGETGLYKLVVPWLLRSTTRVYSEITWSWFLSGVLDFWQGCGLSSAVQADIDPVTDGTPTWCAAQLLVSHVREPARWVTSGASYERSGVTVTVRRSDGEVLVFAPRSNKMVVCLGWGTLRIIQCAIEASVRGAEFRAAAKNEIGKVRGVTGQDFGSYIIESCLVNVIKSALKSSPAQKLATVFMTGDQFAQRVRQIAATPDRIPGDATLYDNNLTRDEIRAADISWIYVFLGLRKTGVLSAAQCRACLRLWCLHWRAMERGQIYVADSQTEPDDVTFHHGQRVGRGRLFAWVNGLPSGRSATAINNSCINMGHQSVVVAYCRVQGWEPIVPRTFTGDDMDLHGPFRAAVRWYLVYTNTLGMLSALTDFVANYGGNLSPMVYLQQFYDWCEFRDGVVEPGLAVGPTATARRYGIAARNGLAMAPPWVSDVDPDQPRYQSDMANLRQIVSRLWAAGAVSWSGVELVHRRLLEHAGIPVLLAYIPATLGGLAVFDERVKVWTVQAHIKQSATPPHVAYNGSPTSTRWNVLSVMLATPLTAMFPVTDGRIRVRYEGVGVLFDSVDLAEKPHDDVRWELGRFIPPPHVPRYLVHSVAQYNPGLATSWLSTGDRMVLSRMTANLRDEIITTVGQVWEYNSLYNPPDLMSSIKHDINASILGRLATRRTPTMGALKTEKLRASLAFLVVSQAMMAGLVASS